MSEHTSFLSSRFRTSDPKDGVNVRIPTDDEIGSQAGPVSVSDDSVTETVEKLQDTISSLRSQIEELQATVRELRTNPPFPDMSAFITTREQIKSLTSAIDRQNIEITNKALVTSMEQIAIMREDFFKLCSGMEKKIDTMSAKDVLASFQAYQVDMENILTDGGVYIGHFPYESLNTIHQRIVEVVPTDDPALNGKIAQRLSDGYKLGNRVLFKEKVSVYKYIENGAQPVAFPAEEAAETLSAEPKAPEEPEAPAEEHPIETISQTTSKKRKNSKRNKMEEEE